MPNLPNPPSRAVAAAAAATGILAALIWLGAFATFAAHWGDRMTGTEVRLALIALALTAIRHALWSFHVRQRGQQEQAANELRLTEMERRLGWLDQGVADIAGRTQRLANCLETIEVAEGSEGPGEETADIIRTPKPRAGHLRPVKSS